MFVKRRGIRFARRFIECDFQLRARFGIAQFHFALACGRAVFFSPKLDKQQFVAEIGQILQRPETIGVVQKI